MTHSISKNIYKIIFVFATTLSCQSLIAQPFKTGHTTIDLIDASRNNRVIATEIYYPADADGDNVILTKSVGEKFPLISFGHGFVMTWDAYKNIWEALVPQGYIVAFPTTESSFAPSHATFGKDLAFVVSALFAKSQETTSIFYNRIDTMNCVMGHSMGGGSAFLAAQFSSAIKTIATLAPAETSPSAIAAAASLEIPSLIFAGGNDCITPPQTNQVPMYKALVSSCKTYISIDGGSHCQMADNNVLCSFGEATCSPKPTISSEQQHSIINGYLIAWLDYQLKKDCMAGAKFDSIIALDPRIDFLKICLLCDVNASVDVEFDKNIEIYPSHFTDRIFIKNNNVKTSSIEVNMFSAYGEIVMAASLQNVSTNTIMELHVPYGLPVGMYTVRLSYDGKSLSRKLIH